MLPNCSVVCTSVCLSVGHNYDYCAKTAEPIEMPFGGVVSGGSAKGCGSGLAKVGFCKFKKPKIWKSPKFRVF